MRDPDRRHGHEQRGDRLGQRVAQPGPEGQHAATGEADPGQSGPGPRQHPEQRRAGDRDRDDEQVEDELVRLAEEVDHELLGAGRLKRDDEVPDGDDRARGTGENARKQLGAAERRGSRRQPGERGAAAAGDPVGWRSRRHRLSKRTRIGTPRTNASPRSWSRGVPWRPCALGCVHGGNALGERS